MKQVPVLSTILLLLSCCSISQAQQSVATNNSAVVPPLVNFSGVLHDANGKSMTGVVGVTFLLYKDQEGGAPLWMETQNVQPDKAGHYTVMLGSTSNQGLPADIFAAGDARWLAVQVVGEQEQARVLLVSAPYALKAGDAETIGGLPPSAFVLANGGKQGGAGGETTAKSASSTATKNSVPPANPAVTGKGVVDYIPMWDTTSDIVDSILFQKTSQIGVNTTAPAATLDVNGKSDVRDTLTLFPKSTDNTLAINGTAFKISNTGAVTFISGQKFPGAGTITGITTASGSGLSGGGTTGTLSLKVPAAGITNAMLQNSKITLNASAAGGLTVPGAMTLGSTYTIGLKTCAANQVLQFLSSVWTCANVAGTGTVTSVGSGTGLTGGPITSSGTLSIDTTKVPLLASANTFSNSDTFASSATGPEISVTNNGTGDGVDVFSTAGDGVFSETDGFDGGDFISLGTGYGSFAESVADANFSAAAAGWQFGASKEDIGVWGFAGSTVGIGNYAEGFAASAEGAKCCGGAYSIGVWADTSGTSGSSAGIAALATVDTGYGLVTYSNSTDSTIWAENDVTGDSSAPVLVATGASGYCLSTVSGNLTCTGTITPAVSINGGANKVAVYGVQAAENWFEDAGSGQLSHGSAVVQLENTFAETVNTGVEYHVFLTPNGDCKGLYVTQKSPTSFEVHELGGGTSNISFDYRIMAKRRGYETVRLADLTNSLRVHGPVQRAPGARGASPDDARKAHQAKVDELKKVAAAHAASVKAVRR